ncbi:MAG TPA: collagen binding domain-containing protein, partial [Kurthia sp.]
MKKKLSAALLSFMLVFQVMSSGYLSPFTALANEAPTTQLNDEETPKAEEKTAEEIAAADKALAKATEAVNSLFADADHKNIVEGLDEYRITTVQSIVNKLEDGDDKTKLDELVTKASLQVTANKEKETVKADKEVPATTEKEKEVTKAPKEDVKTEEELAKAPKKVKASEAGTDTHDAELIKMKFESFLVNGKEVKIGEYHPKIGDTTNINFTWGLGNLHNYNTGDKFTFKLPKNFEIVNFVEGDAGDFATFTVNTDGLVELTLKDVSPNMLVTDGTLTFETKFKKLQSNELEQEIDFGKYGGKQTLTFTPNITETKPTIQKSGKFSEKNNSPLPSNINPEGIDWVITLNEEMADVKNAEVADALPAGLKLDGAISVKKFGPAGLNGEPTGTPTDITVNSFPVNLGDITSKVELSFKTKITNAKVSYQNTATLTGTYKGSNLEEVGTSDELKPLYPEEITKTGAVDNTSINWTVKANMNGAVKKGDPFVLTDTLTAGEDFQKFDGDSVKVFEYDKVNDKGMPSGTSTEVTSKVVKVDGNTLTVTINNSNGKPYVITYKTVKSKAITEEVEVTNKAYITDVSKSVTYKEKIGKSKIITKNHGE